MKQDRQRKQDKNKSENFSIENKSIESRLDQLLVSFSVMRNWYKLTKKPVNNDFNSIHTVKFLLTLAVICGHINAVSKAIPSDNAYFWEENSKSIWAPLFMNSQITIQFFLTSAAFLTGYQFIEIQNKLKIFNIHYLWKGIVYRVMRFKKNVHGQIIYS